MSTGTGSDEEFIRGRTEERRHGSLDEDLATRLTRGVVDGFSEASQAFSNELQGTHRFPELMGRSLAAVIRANARLLDEVATVVRRTADEWAERPRRSAEEDFDYERLADLVAARLSSPAAGSGVVESGDAARSRRKT
jgi:hypothetical protein